jgi:hypothetical protein
VASVASQSELQNLMQRLAVTAPATPELAPAEKSLAQIRTGLMERITPVLTAIWPPQAPFKAFDLAFTESGIVLNVQYQGAAVLDPIALDMIARDLQEKLAAPSLSIKATFLGAPSEKASSVGRR